MQFRRIGTDPIDARGFGAPGSRSAVGIQVVCAIVCSLSDVLIIKQSTKSRQTINKQTYRNMTCRQVNRLLGQVGETMRKCVAVMCFLLVAVDSAGAVECQTNMQSGNEHWAWRLIDGRQCWYKGASGMDKSLLHWSAGKGGLDKPEDPPDKPKMDKAQAMLEAQRIPVEILKMLPIMPPQPTFEDRWRLR
jgi:hypothetical protein